MMVTTVTCSYFICPVRHLGGYAHIIIVVRHRHERGIRRRYKEMPNGSMVPIQSKRSRWRRKVKFLQWTKGATR